MLCAKDQRLGRRCHGATADFHETRRVANPSSNEEDLPPFDFAEFADTITICVEHCGASGLPQILRRSLDRCDGRAHEMLARIRTACNTGAVSPLPKQWNASARDSLTTRKPGYSLSRPSCAARRAASSARTARVRF